MIIIKKFRGQKVVFVQGVNDNSKECKVVWGLLKQEAVDREQKNNYSPFLRLLKPCWLGGLGVNSPDVIWIKIC